MAAASPPSRPSLLDRLFAGVQYLLPHHAVSRLVFGLTRLPVGPLQRLAMRIVIRLYGIDLAEAEEPELRAYPHFNAFFTRALAPGARPVASEEGAVACPVDGAVSEAGVLDGERILQAKGRSYSVAELLGGASPAAGHPWPGCFEGGAFATLYLSPRDYHRIHMPLAGTLRESVHVPGRLFSVQPTTVRAVPNLFARNERVAAIFDTDAGPMAVVMVGAICVAAIETVWAGLVTPPRGREITRTSHPRAGPGAVHLEQGEELGRFNMGSTVILLFGPGAVEWRDGLTAGAPLRMGERVGWVLGGAEGEGPQPPPR